MPRHNNYVPSLCWDCANATGGCSWSQSFEPVEGWKAEREENKLGIGESYRVEECPLFKRDDPKVKKKYITKALTSLFEAVIAQAVTDYETSVRFDVNCVDAEGIAKFFKDMGNKDFVAREERRHRKGIRLIEASLGKPIGRRGRTKCWTCPNCKEETANRASGTFGSMIISCSTCGIKEFVTPRRVDIEDPMQYCCEVDTEVNNGE